MLSICLASTTFVIPLLVVSYSYVRIFKSSKKHFHKITAVKNTRKYNENNRGRTIKKFKAIKTIGFFFECLYYHIDAQFNSAVC